MRSEIGVLRSLSRYVASPKYSRCWPTNRATISGGTRYTASPRCAGDARSNRLVKKLAAVRFARLSGFSNSGSVARPISNSGSSERTVNPSTLKRSSIDSRLARITAMTDS